MVLGKIVKLVELVEIGLNWFKSGWVGWNRVGLIKMVEMIWNGLK